MARSSRTMRQLTKSRRRSGVAVPGTLPTCRQRTFLVISACSCSCSSPAVIAAAGDTTGAEDFCPAASTSHIARRLRLAGAAVAAELSPSPRSAARSAARSGAAGGGGGGGGGGGAGADALPPPSLSRAFSRERERLRRSFFFGERERLRDSFFSFLSRFSRLGDLRGKQAGSDLGQLALSLWRPLSAPDRSSGCPRLRTASANQPVGRRWTACGAWFRHRQWTGSGCASPSSASAAPRRRCRPSPSPSPASASCAGARGCRRCPRSGYASPCGPRANLSPSLLGLSRASRRGCDRLLVRGGS